MIADFFIRKKGSSSALGKLDGRTQKMLEILFSLEERYKRKVHAIADYERAKDHAAVYDAGVLKEIRSILQSLGYEEAKGKKEINYSVRSLEELKELLERWKSNRRLVNLTYREFSDLSMLHESLRNLIVILHRQKRWLEKNKGPIKFKKSLPEFKELLSLEGGLYGKEEALITSARQNDKAMRDALDKEFMYTLVGYGTLMNGNETMNELKSTLQKAGTRIKDIEAEFRARVTPVWVLAFKRVFNKIATRRKWETEEDVAASRVAVLNISGSMNHKFNGVAIKLTENEYLAIREREKNYGIIGLKYVYDYRTGTRLKEKCICVKSNPLKSDVTVSRRDRLEFYRQRLLKYSYGLDPDRLLKTNKMPIPRYIETIDIGVKLLDGLLGTVGMYDNYLKTTYCYYISRDEKKDYGEITLERYYRIIGMEIAQELHAAS